MSSTAEEHPTGPVLVAYDGSDHAERATRAAAALLPGRETLVMTVWIPTRDAARAARLALPGDLVAAGAAALDDEARGDARRVAEDGARVATEAGLRARAIEAPRKGTEAATISAAADHHDASVIVVGSRGRSALKSTLLGSTTYRLLHTSRRPILVAHDEHEAVQDGPILLCFDGSRAARDAAEAAGRLFPGVFAVVAHVWQPTDDRELLRSAANPILAPRLQELARELNKAGHEQAEAIATEGTELARTAGLKATPRTAAEHDGIVVTLAQLAEEEGARVLVAGSRGQSPVSSLVIGSVSHGLLHQAIRPVLVVPSG